MEDISKKGVAKGLQSKETCAMNALIEEERRISEKHRAIGSTI